MFLEFPAGSFTKDGGSPPTEDGQGLIFAADGADHIAGSSAYLPVVFRAPSVPVTLTFSFLPIVLGVSGIARFDMQYYIIDGVSIIATGSHTFYVNSAGTFSVDATDIDISSWLSSASSKLFIFTITRNSSNAGDTLNASIALLNAHTNEI